mmetsp:Transcript_45982/g.82923  ORF Transcript_45982/g.82923 Transcript_45982/m.82923 type:complete len:116 (+) Transcript_45982:49-396(+)
MPLRLGEYPYFFPQAEKARIICGKLEVSFFRQQQQQQHIGPLHIPSTRRCLGLSRVRIRAAADCTPCLRRVRSATPSGASGASRPAGGGSKQMPTFALNPASIQAEADTTGMACR